MIYASGGNDVIDGGEGVDTVAYYNSNSGSVNFSLTTGVVIKSNGTTDALYGVENAYGGRLDDTIVGNASDNALFGYLGNDILLGDGGNDVIYAGQGNDTIDGGDGIDVVYYIHAPAGQRLVADLSLGSGAATRYDVTTNAVMGTDNIVNVERVYATANNDTLSGTNDANVLWGSAATIR